MSSFGCILKPLGKNQHKSRAHIHAHCLVWYHYINMKTGSRTEQASCELQLNSPPYRAARGRGSLLAFTIFTAYIQLQNKGGGNMEVVVVVVVGDQRKSIGLDLVQARSLSRWTPLDSQEEKQTDIACELHPACLFSLTFRIVNTFRWIWHEGGCYIATPRAAIQRDNCLCTFD